jgi:hypothetical protein
MNVRGNHEATRIQNTSIDVIMQPTAIGRRLNGTTSEKTVAVTQLVFFALVSLIILIGLLSVGYCCWRRHVARIQRQLDEEEGNYVEHLDELRRVTILPVRRGSLRISVLSQEPSFYSGDHDPVNRWNKTDPDANMIWSAPFHSEPRTDFPRWSQQRQQSAILHRPLPISFATTYPVRPPAPAPDHSMPTTSSIRSPLSVESSCHSADDLLPSSGLVSITDVDDDTSS